LIWVLYVVNRILEFGPWPALKNPEPDALQKAAWACRAEAAHRNAVENLVIFAPLVLTVQVLGLITEGTAMACMVFFAARVAHAVIYIAGVPVLRTLAFATGVACQVYLALQIIG
jgi:uncharacterized MAPEG superfamily protein